jgi:hypothetical protein
LLEAGLPNFRVLSARLTSLRSGCWGCQTPRVARDLPGPALAVSKVTREEMLRFLVAPFSAVTAPLLIISQLQAPGVGPLIVFGLPMLCLALPLSLYFVRFRVVAGDGWIAQRGLLFWHLVDLSDLRGVAGRSRNSRRIFFRDHHGGRVLLWDLLSGSQEVERVVRLAVWRAHRRGAFELRPEVQKALWLWPKRFDLDGDGRAFDRPA